jgi:hypothetical protein
VSECEYCDWEGHNVCGAEHDDGYMCTRPAGHDDPHVACATAVHECRTWSAEGASEEAAPERAFTVISWDWKEHLDLEALDAALALYDRPTIVNIDDTGSDQCAAVVAERPLGREEAERLFWEWAREDDS